MQTDHYKEFTNLHRMIGMVSGLQNLQEHLDIIYSVLKFFQILCTYASGVTKLAKPSSYKKR